MRKVLLSLVAAASLAALCVPTGAQAATARPLAAVEASNGLVQRVDYGGWRYWQWRRHEAWLRHERWEAWRRHEAWRREHWAYWHRYRAY